jgi:hypothetical protein
MSFLHNWRRSNDNNYRWETAAEQGIIDAQEDVEFEIWQLRQELALLREELAAAREQNNRPEIDEWWNS